MYCRFRESSAAVNTGGDIIGHVCIIQRQESIIIAQTFSNICLNCLYIFDASYYNLAEMDHRQNVVSNLHDRMALESPDMETEASTVL